MPEKKNSQTGNFLSWLFKKHFLKLEIIFTPTIDKEPKKLPQYLPHSKITAAFFLSGSVSRNLSAAAARSLQHDPQISQALFHILCQRFFTGQIIHSSLLVRMMMVAQLF